MGEPIVYSPAQALDVFMDQNDTLVMGNYIIRK